MISSSNPQLLKERCEHRGMSPGFKIKDLGYNSTLALSK